MNRACVQDSAANTRRLHRLDYIANALGVLVALVGAGYLSAWLSGHMTQLGFSTITMKANTALSLLLTGLGLVLLVRDAVGVRRWIGRIVAALAALIGLLSLSENLIGWDLGIDELLAKELPGALGVLKPNLMGTPAAISFLLTGLALMIFSRRDRRGVKAAQGMAGAVFLISLLGTIGYLYGAQSLKAIVSVTGVAWPTSLSLLMLSVGLLLARPTEGMMAQITADNPGGENFRRWLPVLLLPVVLGWLRIAGERQGVFDAVTGTAIMMIIFIVALAVLAYRSASKVGQSSSALLASEERLRKTYECAPVGICEVDLDGRFTNVNQHLCDITGYPRDELLQKKFNDITHSDDIQTDVDLYRRMQAGEMPFFTLEKRYLHKDGHVVMIHLTATLVMDQQDQPSFGIGIIQDITKQKRAEEEIRKLLLDVQQERTRLSSLINSISDEVWFADTQGRFTIANPSALGAFGISGNDIVEVEKLAKSLEVLRPDGSPRPAEEAPPLRGLLGEVIRNQEEIVRTPATGELRHREVSTTPVKDDKGEIIGSVSIARDITDRKRAEQELRLSEEKFVKAFAVNPAAVVMTRLADGVFMDINDTWVALTGYGRDEVIGRSAREMHIWPTVEAMTRFVQDLKAKGYLRGWEQEFIKKSGETYVAQLAAQVLNVQGEDVILSTLVDITDRKRAEMALREQTQQLEAVNKELEAFIYSVSHDLRAPLRHIYGFADLLMKNNAEKLDEKGNRYLSGIHTGTEKMSRLIDDLLKLSQISKQEIRQREVSLSEIATSIVSELREANPDRNVDVDIAGGITVFADKGLIELVLSNLIGNAWKFTSKTEHARVEFSTIRQDGRVIYYVRDNGAGFDQQYAGKMFWPFHRLHSEGAFEGTGIGLAIVERIIRSHGGKIWAEGEEGKGATVYFSLR